MKTNSPRLLAVALLLLSLAMPAAAQAPANGPEITELEQTLTDIPKDLILAVRSGNRKEAAAKEATDLLRSKMMDRTATLKFKVEKVEKEPVRNGQPERYRVKAEDSRLRSSVTSFKAYLWVHFDAAESAKVATLKKGAEITATGRIATPFISSETAPALHMDLGEAKLKP